MPFDRAAIQRLLASRFIWASWVLAIPVAGSFLGRLHWALDLTTHFRAQYAAAGLLLAIGCAACGRRRAALAPLAIGLINVAYLAPLYLPHDEPSATAPAAARLKIVSLNVYAGSQAYDDVIGYLRSAQPDVALFTELTPAWRDALRQLEAEYPSQHFAPRGDAFGIGIIAKPVLRDVRIEPLGGLFPYVRANLDVAGRTVALFGVHPPPPMGSELARMRNVSFAALNELARHEQGPTIVVGDFNSTTWSPHFTDMLAGTRLRDSRLGRGVQPSWSTTHPLPLRISIDHILVSPEVRVVERRLGSYVGSDHLPLELEFTVGP